MVPVVWTPLSFIQSARRRCWREEHVGLRLASLQNSSCVMILCTFALLAAFAAPPSSEAASFVVVSGTSKARRRAMGDVSRLPAPLMMNKRASKRRGAGGGGFGKKKPRVTSMNIKKRVKSDFVYAG